MMRYIITILACVQFGCGQVVDAIKIEPRFVTYTAEFDALFDKYLPGQFRPQTSSQFGQVDSTEAAECRISGVNRMVTVDEKYWSTLCDEQRRALIFHELGHCVLGKGHSPDIKSYMFATLQSCAFYPPNKDAMIKELFTF